MNFANIISDEIYKVFVIRMTEKYTMDYLVAEKKTFKTFKHCLYATDVTQAPSPINDQI